MAPYGLGYETGGRGVHEGIDTEKEGSEEVWRKTGKINYSRVNWSDAQDRCFKANRQRFLSAEEEEERLLRQSTSLDSDKQQAWLRQDKESFSV